MSRAEAKELAEKGEFVVAGLKGKKNGHVAVVVPGKGDRGYPNIAGGALGTVSVSERKLKNGKTVIGGFDKNGKPTAYSEGGLTVNYAWDKNARDKVEYFTPNQNDDE